MSVLTTDTDPAIAALQVAHLRQLAPRRKWELVNQMTQMACTFALAGLRQRCPHDTPARRQRRLADLLLGPELAARAYGPLPEEG